jgi:hypothetical protein
MLILAHEDVSFDRQELREDLALAFFLGATGQAISQGGHELVGLN